MYSVNEHRFDAALWTEASQLLDLSQRLPVKASPAREVNCTLRHLNPAYLESLEFLKRHSLRFYTDQESEQAEPPTATIASEPGRSTPSLEDFSTDLEDNVADSLTEPVPVEVMQESEESDDSHCMESDASSDKGPPSEDGESEAVEQRPSLRHSCAYCDYSTSHKMNLVHHVRTHTGSKPFRCEECDYRTAQKGHLTVHLRIHTGEKPYRCERCDFRAADRSCLNVHKRMHTGLKPYACPLCAFQTAYKVSLDKHLRTHTGEKPYKCPQCEYRSTQSGNIHLHVRRMH
ncbi:zinc finger protein [Aphelenchoides avenae]|nr:zinc finger protein [Aphelenchus avenae]